ncbi:EscN/YscN/HrcN family type III secretion system ATPase, partial [Xanthomonas perforans]|nr:EscN/YscN/HrcN family type III secretion system ATPase [Xanthomonas perforans]
MLAETPLLETTLERELATLAVGRRYGKVVEVVGTMLKVAGVQVSLGEVCELRQRHGTLLQRAGVVGFSRDLALLV